MSIIFPLLLSITWFYNIETAKEIAQQENKNIIIIFSGSDWCRSCMKLNENIIESKAFIERTASKFVFLKADFPQRTNKMLLEQIKLNEKLAEKYNPKGNFPFIVLTNKEGSILKARKGYKGESIDEILNFIFQ